jgi:replicative DNA helicase
MRETRQLFSLEAEMSVLGSMLLSERAAAEAVSILRVDHFHRPAHQVLFAFMAEMTRRFQAVDIVTLRDGLAKGAKLAEVGGDEYLMTVAEYTPSPANVRHYCEIVRERWVLRNMIEQAQRLIGVCQDPEKTVEDVRAFAHSIGSADTGVVVPFVHLGELDHESQTALGVSTGWPMLDALISTGGYPSGQMTVVRAYHKGGKSTFMLSSFIAAARAGKRAGYATFADLSGPQLKRRVVRALTGCAKRPDNLHGAADYQDRVDEIARDWAAFVYDASAIDSGADVETFAAWLKAEHARKPFDVFFVDYAQEIHSTDRKAHTEVSEQNIVAGKISRAAAQLGIPLIVGSQITEGTDGQKAKTKYSRAWEEKAGWVLTLRRQTDEATGDPTDVLLVEVTYSRFGVQDRAVAMRWNDEYLRIDEFA